MPRRTPSYGRFTVSQGIIVDPEHPGEATVYAVVMDAQELSALRAKLLEAFPANVEEAEPKPEVVTELAEVGRVSVFPGVTVADVFVPSEGPKTALKAEPKRMPDAVRFESGMPDLGSSQVTDPVGPRDVAKRGRCLFLAARTARSRPVRPLGAACGPGGVGRGLGSPA